ncbi:hypothetical protein AAG906_002677 [Vitis piasezkii]
MMASRLPRSLTAARRVMMALPPPRGIMTSQKVFPSLKREAELLTLYKRGQLNQNSILVESVRPLGSYVDHRDARSSIHWDLKTSNILFDNYMYSKISDFGLARTFGENESKAKHKKGCWDIGRSLFHLPIKQHTASDCYFSKHNLET